MIYQPNIFTKIVNKIIPSKIVLENNFFLVIEDINPQAPIHFLLLPKKSYIDYIDFLKNSSIEEQKIYNTTILDLINQYNLDNAKILTNYKEKAGQVIFHFHLHIMSY